MTDFDHEKLDVYVAAIEGAGEFSGNEKSRFYRMAKRSATQCAAIIHVCRRLGLVEDFAVCSRPGASFRVVAPRRVGHGLGHEMRGFLRVAGRG
jgi:hypothetical protein